MKIAERIITKNDINGNPRRGWRILALKSKNLLVAYDWIDEDYTGDANLYISHPNIAVTTTIVVTPSEYRRLRKEAMKTFI